MQFDVYPNPVVRARRAFPYVVMLQSDVAETGADRIVASLAPHATTRGVAGRLMPLAEVAGRTYVVMMPSITGLPAADLKRPVDNIGAHRDKIVEALDWLFLGV